MPTRIREGDSAFHHPQRRQATHRVGTVGCGSQQLGRASPTARENTTRSRCGVHSRWAMGFADQPQPLTVPDHDQSGLNHAITTAHGCAIGDSRRRRASPHRQNRLRLSSGRPGTPVRNRRAPGQCAGCAGRCSWPIQGRQDDPAQRAAPREPPSRPGHPHDRGDHAHPVRAGHDRLHHHADEGSMSTRWSWPTG